MSFKNGADIIIESLEKLGVKYVSGIPGGSNLPIYDALYKSKIKHILARHEQGAGFIAQGIARSTNDVGVCIVSSGPGATNLLTSIADAKMDSVPLVAITGQVPLSMVGTDAFQEIDTYGLTIPITKHNFFVTKAEDLYFIISEAFRISKSGRPGPVVIDVPKDVQLELINFSDSEICNEIVDNELVVHTEENEQNILKIVNMIHVSKKPLLYIGGGVVNSNSSELIIELSKINSIPVTSTLMGISSIPFDNPLFIGMIGMHGAPYTNIILDEIDLLLAFGVRFDDRATGKVQEFCKNAKIVHIDVDASEHNKIKQIDIFINSDLRNILKKLIPLIEKNERTEWISHLEYIRSKYPFPLPPSVEIYHPINVLKKLGNIAADDAIVTTDVGQHQMWVAQVYPFKQPHTFITSGGLGTMGFGLPVAIGIALANPKKQVICVSGDGSILMNIQELATLSELNLNVKIIILNNFSLGLVRQQQELFYNKNFIASKYQQNIDFSIIGKSFGIDGFNFKDVLEPYSQLEETIKNYGPCLVDIPIQESINALPMVPPGFANRNMIGERK